MNRSLTPASGSLLLVGARALTHLNIDRDLGLSDGSTSYYARARRDLIGLIVERLATRASDELAAQGYSREFDPQIAASIIVSGLDATMRRVEDHRGPAHPPLGML